MGTPGTDWMDGFMSDHRLTGDQTLARSFREDGFVCIPGFLDAGTIGRVLERITAIRDGSIEGIPESMIYFEDREDPSTLKQIQQLFRWDPLFHELMFESAPMRLAQALLQDQPVGRNMQYFNKPPQVGQATPAHQDGFYFMLEPPEAVTMWLALEPVDEENGCVRYLRGSHREGVLPHRRTETLGFSQAVVGYEALRARYDEVALPAAPGTLLAHHALTIHRADGNRSATRKRQALGFIYYAASAREDRDRHDAYQKALAADLAAAGKI